jgi:preprotein translocase subunit YajC
MEFLLQAPPPAGGGDLLSSLGVPLAAMFAIMYFMVIRPQNKERKKQEEMRNALKKGDRVVTQSGIVAEIRQMKDGNEVVLSLDGRAEMTVLKSTILQVLGAPAASK